MALLECRKLKKVYETKDSRTVAVTNFNLDFPDGGIVAIQGKSGSGKSTLLCLLSGVEKPDAGNVVYKGKDITSFTKKERIRFAREETSFVFQHYGLFEEKTVYENIMLPLRMIGKQRSQTKESVNFLLSHFGLDGYEKRKVSTLSGGEKQRVALIRALVKAPRILFADEPTGALDEANGEEVMKMLSSMSAQSLIIMVSHNSDLVERYADSVITLKDGMKVRSKVAKEREYQEVSKKKTRYSSSWIFGFLASFLGEDRKRNLLTFFSGFIGLSCIMLSVGYFLGSPRSIDRNGSRALDYYSAYLSKKETVSISDSPLSLTRQKKPSREEAESYLKDFENVSIEDDLSYFFPSNQLYQLGEESFSDALFTPIYDITLSEHGKDFLIKGEAYAEDSLGVCYVNDCFDNAHHVKVGDKIAITLQIPVKNKEIGDDISLDLEFEVKGVTSEFSFLNSPKVYYSYPAFSSMIREVHLPSLSSSFHQDMTVEDFLSIYPGSYLGNGYQIFFHSKNDVAKAFGLMAKGGKLVLDSSSYTAISSFSSLSEAFQMCLLLLLGISIIGIVGITGMSFLSLFLKRKQEIALLFSLGATRREAMSIFLAESGLITLLYGGLAILAYPYMEKGFNFLLNMNFGMSNLISMPSALVMGNVRIPLLALFLVAAVLVGLISSALPILLSMRKGLRKELRDE